MRRSAITFAVLALQFPNAHGRTPASTQHLVHPRHRLDLAFVGAASARALRHLGLLMIAGTSNGVNLTDGLDGLATGRLA